MAVDDGGGQASARCEFLGLARLQAACGVIDREPD
jgi:hypothetical protein